MLRLKSFSTAAVVTGGIELAEKIKKGHFKIGKLSRRTARMLEILQTALAAYVVSTLQESAGGVQSDRNR